MSPRARVLASTLVLEHVPDLVRYGSKPSREPERLHEINEASRSYEQAVGYPPNQAFIGNLPPEELWELARPWWAAADGGRPAGAFGEISDQRTFFSLMEEVDGFDLIRLDGQAAEEEGVLPLFDGHELAGGFFPAHPVDEALQASILLENLACKASAVHALRFLRDSAGIDPDSIQYVIGAGEEAVGDRYQRGGGSLGKAIAESCGLREASGSDVKAFCAGPLHALVMAGSLVESGTFERVAVVAGGSLAKLGMKSLGARRPEGMPVLEDVLAGMAIVVGISGEGPTMRLDAVGRHRIGSGSSQEGLLTDIVAEPLQRMGRTIPDIDRFATELHNPEITEAAGGGDVPDRNYRLLASLGVIRGELPAADVDGFSMSHGLPGFAPTQGHIASAVPWLPHALVRFETGELRSTMLVAKGSLFLGRMTNMWDGISITLEA
jgi:glycine/sarcosine/betaine reductase complex component C subunit beta